MSNRLLMSVNNMEKSRLCRICLTKGVRMYNLVNSYLQETYESLTAMQFEIKGSRPSQVCYICYAQLQTCHKLRSKSLHSEELFHQVSDSSELKLASLHNVIPLLTIQLVTVLSIVPLTHDVTDNNVKDYEGEPSLDCSNIIDNVQENEKHVEATEDVFDGVGLVDGNDGNASKTKDAIMPLSTINNNERRSPVASRDNFCPETVKTALKRLESTNIVTSVPAPMELGFTDWQNQTRVSGEEVGNGPSAEHIDRKGYLPSQIDMDITDKPYKCDICGKRFKGKKNFLKHGRLHTDIGVYACNICGQDFTRNYNLSCHLLKHTGIRAYPCKICGKRFTSGINLSSHISTHTSVKAYTCDICGKDFKKKYNLTCHRRTHSSEKAYACNICGKRFANSVYLSRHNSIHTSMKAYTCDICKKDYKRKDQLSQHILIHTSTRAYSCDICGKRFTCSMYLKRHIRKHT